MQWFRASYVFFAPVFYSNFLFTVMFNDGTVQVVIQLFYQGQYSSCILHDNFIDVGQYVQLVMEQYSSKVNLLIKIIFRCIAEALDLRRCSATCRGPAEDRQRTGRGPAAPRLRSAHAVRRPAPAAIYKRAIAIYNEPFASYNEPLAIRDLQLAFSDSRYTMRR